VRVELRVNSWSKSPAGKKMSMEADDTVGIYHWAPAGEDIVD
jgi:hypothetical protein